MKIMCSLSLALGIDQQLHSRLDISIHNFGQNTVACAGSDRNRSRPSILKYPDLLLLVLIPIVVLFWLGRPRQKLGNETPARRSSSFLNNRGKAQCGIRV